ncbi:MAG TPA: hypothetical protein DDW67_10205 [Elusimicrobia bacterium]|jgi:4-amino-4-deoxy-L-arabinose transferase-like glycosyltransferase|nr:hypothetical protein [Elusimicrobiota bacterium]
MTITEKVNSLPGWAVPAAIFLFALAARLAYVFSAGIHTMPDIDSVEYLNYAKNLIAGEGYTDGRWRAFRAPGYPFFAAGVFGLFGESLPALKVVQAAVSSSVPVMVYFIGRRLGGRAVALGAGFFSCFYFGLVFEPHHLVSEALFTPLFVLAVLLLLKTEEDWRYSLPVGVVLGLTTLTRPVGLLVIAAGALWIFLRLPLRRALKVSLFVFLSICAVMAPWWARNYRVFGTFVPVCLETGFVVKHTGTPPELLDFNDGMPELERDRRNLEEGLSYIRSRPGHELFMKGIRELSRFLYPFLPAYDTTYMLILPFWLYGLYAIVRSRDERSYLLFSMFIYFPIAFIFCGTTRYRHSLGAFFILIAALGVKDLAERARASGRGRALAGAAAVWAALNVFIHIFSEPARFAFKSFLGI